MRRLPYDQVETILTYIISAVLLQNNDCLASIRIKLGLDALSQDPTPQLDESASAFMYHEHSSVISLPRCIHILNVRMGR